MFIRDVAGHFGFRIMLASVGSRRAGSWIVLARRLPVERRREDFFHELAHGLMHAEHQLNVTIT